MQMHTGKQKYYVSLAKEFQHHLKKEHHKNGVSIIIDLGIIAPEHGKEVPNGLNTFDKTYIYQLMSKVQLPVSYIFDS